LFTSVHVFKIDHFENKNIHPRAPKKVRRWSSSPMPLPVTSHQAPEQDRERDGRRGGQFPVPQGIGELPPHVAASYWEERGLETGAYDSLDDRPQGGAPKPVHIARRLGDARYYM